MKVAITALLWALTFTSTCYAADSGGMTAKDLQEICADRSADNKAACRFYILGLAQGISLGMAIADGKTEGGRTCIPNIAGSALERVVKRKLDQDLAAFPGDKNLEAAGVVSAIFVTTFSCEKNR